MAEDAAGCIGAGFGYRRCGRLISRAEGNSKAAPDRAAFFVGICGALPRCNRRNKQRASRSG